MVTEGSPAQPEGHPSRRLDWRSTGCSSHHAARLRGEGGRARGARVRSRSLPILFCMHRNTCRSPLAEVLGPSGSWSPGVAAMWRFRSGGVRALRGPMPARGRVGWRRARTSTITGALQHPGGHSELLEWADLVLGQCLPAIWRVHQACGGRRAGHPSWANGRRKRRGRGVGGRDYRIPSAQGTMPSYRDTYGSPGGDDRQGAGPPRTHRRPPDGPPGSWCQHPPPGALADPVAPDTPSPPDQNAVSRRWAGRGVPLYPDLPREMWRGSSGGYRRMPEGAECDPPPQGGGARVVEAPTERWSANRRLQQPSGWRTGS